LFEIEVPEVFNGMVEIKSIARESGSRSKVAVVARQDGIDPVGSCIGMRGNRIQSIVNELQGEKIDVVRWDKDIKVLISNALSPSEVIHVEMDKDEETALVVVPERQLSLAIGKEGQNARLAARLTGFRLDIKSMSEWEAIKAQRQADEEEAARAAARAKLEAAVVVAQPKDTLAELETEAVPIEASVESLSVEEVIGEILEPVLSDSFEIELEEQAVGEPQPIEAEEAQVAEEVLAASGLSPEEELALLALEEEDEEDEEEEGTEELSDDIWNVPVAPSGAGQIRFAEDIMGEFRGRGRREGKGRRGSQNDAGKAKKGGGGAHGRRAPRAKSGAATPARAEQPQR
jgi:transcription antitermination factor NusA-like protein